MVNELKYTFGFNRKLNASAYGGKQYESIDFTAVIEVPSDGTKPPAVVYEENQASLQELYQAMFSEAVRVIQEEAAPPKIAKPATSPFSRAKKTL